MLGMYIYPCKGVIMKTFIVITAVLVAMSSTSAYAAYNAARAEASKPASAKAATASSGHAGSAGKSTGRGRPANKASNKVSSVRHAAPARGR